MRERTQPSGKIGKILSMLLAMLLVVSTYIVLDAKTISSNEVSSMPEINRGLPAVPDKGAAPQADDFVLVYGSEQAAVLYMDATDKNNSERKLLDTIVAPYTHYALKANATKADIYRSTYSDSKNALIENSDGAGIALKTLASDIELVSGIKPTVTNDLSSISGMAVIAGTIGESATIDSLIANGKITTTDINNKWESYVIKVVNNPIANHPNITRALVIAGSDMRGTIYGIYKISEAIGVSPWVWWADSYPVRSAKLTFSGTTEIIQGEPDVKYRGIFLNDENPGLSPWVNEFFKEFKVLERWGSSVGSAGYNHHFYVKVFELLLRLKGNYLWPAMWNNAFHMDDPLNGILANQMGIVMGSSHHEHMDRADKEWNWAGKGNTWIYDEATGIVTKKAGVSGTATGEWDWSGNKQNIINYWRASIIERADRETIVTLGMRGQEDTPLIPEGTTEQNVATLGQIIDEQVKILEGTFGEEGAKEVPKTLILYKEVEEYYYGFQKTDAEVAAGGFASMQGLVVTDIGDNKNIVSLDVPDHVTLMLCDDNFGNVRTLPTTEMLSERYDSNDKFNPSKGGFGMYYHFDYHGGPISHEWLGQTPLEKVNDNMTKAYEAGVDRIWIVNVGDLKPKELLIDYFINLGYDYDKYKDINMADEFINDFLTREFADASAETIKKGEEALNTYFQLTGARKAETLAVNTLALHNFDEADRILRQWEVSVAKAEAGYDAVLDYKKDAWYQHVLFPVRAAYNVYRMNIYAYFSKVYAKEKLPIANVYADLSELAFQQDALDHGYYNSTLANKKWYQLMAQKHINYTQWDSARVRGPEVERVDVKNGIDLAIRLINTSAIVKSGTAADTLSFNTLANEAKYIDIYNAKGGALNFKASASAEWIVLGSTKGVSNGKARLAVNIDPAKVSADSIGKITISAGGKSIAVNVSVKKFNTTLTEKTYLETDGYVSIAPERFVNHNEVTQGVGDDAVTYKWMTIENYGRDYGARAIRVNHHGQYWENADEVPYVEYKFYIQNAGKYRVNVFLTPAVNSKDKVQVPLLEQLRFAMTIDGWTDTKTSIAEGFHPGNYSPTDWQYGVLNNTRMIQSDEVTLAAGEHVLKISAVDAGVVIQKIIIADSEVNRTQAHAGAQAYHFQNSYLGAPESFYQGAPVKPIVAIGNDVLTQAEKTNGTVNQKKGCKSGCKSDAAIAGIIVIAVVFLAEKRTFIK